MTTNDPLAIGANFRTPVHRVLYDADLKESVWGVEIPEVKAALSAIQPTGVWVNLCAGDGRYLDLLLPSVDRVTVVDLDPDGLERLVHRAPLEQRQKIVPLIHDVVVGLPFSDNAVDGVLLTGSLHLFHPGVVRDICRELVRILRPGAAAIVDFCFDIRRVRDDGSLLVYPDEYAYGEDEAIQLLSESLGAHQARVSRLQTPLMQVRLGEVAYTYASKGWVVSLLKH